jgi:hypothetical protein
MGAVLCADGAEGRLVVLLLGGFALALQILASLSKLQLGFDDRVHSARLLCAELDAVEEHRTRMGQPLLPPLRSELASLATPFVPLGSELASPLGPLRSRRRIADPGIRAVRRFQLRRRRRRRRLRVRGAHGETDAGARNQDCDCTAQAYRTHYCTP